MFPETQFEIQSENEAGEVFLFLQLQRCFLLDMPCDIVTGDRAKEYKIVCTEFMEMPEMN